MKKISVLMGIYNCEQFLEEAVNSILNQTYGNWELIMCDDGSTDNTYTLASQFAEQDSRIILLKNKKNLGLNKTLNVCLANATGDYIARMDGDDLCAPDRFEKELSFLEEHSEYSIVTTPMVYFDENGEYRRGKGGRKILPEAFPMGTPINHAPCMVRKEAYLAVNGYTVADNRLRVEDWDLWLKMYEKGYRAYILDECLYMMRDDRNAYKRRKYKYRINEAGMTVASVKRLYLSPKYYIYLFRPLIVGLLPKSIYLALHKRNTK